VNESGDTRLSQATSRHLDDIMQQASSKDIRLDTFALKVAPSRMVLKIK